MAKGKKLWQSPKTTGSRNIYVFTFCSFKTSQNILMLIVFSARFLSKDGRLLSTVLPPPPITTGQQSKTSGAHAYCPMYGLMYLLVNQEEIWVYYTKYAQ